MSQTDSKSFLKPLRVEADLPSLLKHFGEVFSGETIWIRELLQNCRRAGAARIDLTTDRSDPHYLMMADNGCGIGDFQALLTMGRSGWEPEVIERDNPFGLGFYAALYAASTVEIRSGGKRLRLNTGRLLAGEAVETTPCETHTGTVIVLHLKKPLPSPFQPFLERMICGFPIPVHLNGCPLPHPYALDRWEGERFELPDATVLARLDPDIRYEKGITFLQGLIVSKGDDYRRSWPNFDRRGMRLYVHLHGERWRVRVPDRDSLYDSDETRKGVEALQEEIIRAAAERIAARGETERYFECLLEWGCFDVIRDLPIPPGRWHRFFSTVHLPHHECEDLDDAFEPVPPDEIPTPENGRRFIRGWSSINAYDDTLDHLFAAYAFGIPILDSWHDPDHWFSKTSAGEEIDDFYGRRISVSVKEGDRVAEGSWWGKRVVICKRFTLALEGIGQKEITEDAFLNDTFWIIDGELRCDYPIDQAFSFQTEGEEFDEAGMDAAMEAFRSNLAVIKGDIPGLIRSALRDHAGPLQGLRFVVQGANREIVVEPLD